MSKRYLHPVMESTAASLEYEAIGPADQPRLFALMQRIYPPSYAYLWPDDGAWYVESQYGEENFRRELAEPGAAYAFVRCADRDVGIVRTLAGRPLPDVPGRPATKLHRLYLDPAVHGRGIGRGVMGKVVADCRSRGDALVWLEAMDSSAAALAFYARLGFVRTAPFRLDMPLMYPARRGMWRMAKHL